MQHTLSLCPFTHSIAYATNTQPQTNMDQEVKLSSDLPSDQLAQHLVQNPAQFSQEIPQILERSDAVDTLALIFKQLIEETKCESKNLVGEYICEGFSLLPHKMKRHLIEDHPFVFAKLINYLNFEQRQGVLKKITKEREDWKDLFMDVFELFDLNEKNQSLKNLPAARFLKCILKALPNRCKRQWIKFCSHELFINNWAFFMVCLKGKDRALALRASVHSFDYELAQEGFLDCFESLSLQMHHRTQVQEIVDALLHKFYRAKKFDVLVNQFLDLSLNAQVCLLYAMSYSKQDLIFQKYRTDSLSMAAWLAELLVYQTDFSMKKETVQHICNTLKGGTLSEFLQMLNARNAKCGAYLLACLPYELFQEFIFTIPISLRTDLLLNSAVDSTSLHALRSIQEDGERKQIICEVMGLNMENPVVPIEAHTVYTLNHCYQLLKDLNPELASDYSPFIACIPPVLMGILCMSYKEQRVLMELAPYMNEEQLKFFIQPIPVKQLCKFVEKLASSLGSDRFIALLEGLSSNKLVYYTQFKTKKLEQAYQDFNEKYREFQSAFDNIEEGELLTTQDVEEFQKQVFALHSLSRIPFSFDYRCLCKFLEDQKNLKLFSATNLKNLHETLEKLKCLIDNLNAKRSLFEGPHALVVEQMAHINDLQIDKEEDIDLTMILHPNFWLLVREGTLPYLGISPHSQLGITHTGQLTCLGIRSDKDLELLGISPESQKQVDHLISDLENLQSAKDNKSSNAMIIEDEDNASPSIHMLWQECVDIKLDDVKIQDLCKKITLNLIHSHIQPIQFKEGCLSFCYKLLKFPHVSNNEQLLIQAGCEALLSCQKNEHIIHTGMNLLIQALMVLRGQHPLFCLKRYLNDNSHLKQTWENFRIKGYHSINDLYENQIVKTFADFLKLGEIILVGEK